MNAKQIGLEVIRQCHDLRYDGESPAFVVLDRLSYIELDEEFRALQRGKYDPDAPAHIERYAGLQVVVAFSDCVFVRVVAEPQVEALRPVRG